MDAPDPVFSFVDLPDGVLSAVCGFLRSHDQASARAVDSRMKDAVAVALAARKVWSSCDNNDVSHLKASRLFKFLARYCPSLSSISCCFAADRLYGGTLLESSLGTLAAATPHLTQLTLLNVDVTDAVLQHLGRHCSALQHLAIGRTENNAFGNFVSDEGLAVLAQSCRQLSSLWLFRCFSCSDAGLHHMIRQGRQIHSLVLHSCPQITAPGLVTFIEASPCLQLLDVLLPESGPSGAAVNFETAFALAANCPGLRVLRLSEEQLTGGVLDDDCLTVVARGCTQLQELELVQIEVSDAFMAVLATHCTQLTSLRLEQTYVGGQGVDQLLSAVPGLRELRVAGCSTHSWMLPAEYMFAGLSVADLRRLASKHPAVGAQLTSLDLSCLSLEPAEATEVAAIAAAAAAAEAVAAAAEAVAAAVEAAAVLDAGTADAALASSSSSSSTDSLASSCAMPSALLQCNDDHHHHQQQQQQEEGEVDAVADSMRLLPAAWCAQLVSLSLDWIKLDGSELQECLVITLASCSSLTRLSLIGYQGSVDSLLAAVGYGTVATDEQKKQQQNEEQEEVQTREDQQNNGDAADAEATCSSSSSSSSSSSGQYRSCSNNETGAHETAAAAVVAVAGAHARLRQLNLQHSLVTDAGLAVAAEAFPGLTSLKLGYCRHVADPGLTQVGHLQHLEELDLYNTPCVSAAAVARLARYSRSLTRLYIGHNTSALNRSPATATAMGYITNSCNSLTGSPNKYCNISGTSSSVWSAVSQAAAARGAAARLAVLSRNPSSESNFEKRSLQALLGGSCMCAS